MSKRTIPVSDATFRAIAHEHGFVVAGEPGYIDAQDKAIEPVQMITLQSEEGRKLSIRLHAVAKAGYREGVRPFQHKLAGDGLTRPEANAAWELIRDLGY